MNPAFISHCYSFPPQHIPLPQAPRLNPSRQDPAQSGALLLFIDTAKELNFLVTDELPQCSHTGFSLLRIRSSDSFPHFLHVYSNIGIWISLYRN
jgi:hypothetical protein